MHNKITGLLLIVIFGVSTAVNASTEEAKKIAPQPTSNYSENSKETNIIADAREIIDAYSTLNKIVKNNSAMKSGEVEILESKIRIQSEQIDVLKAEIANIKIPANHDLTAIVLTAVAVIITTLGVLIAILSIYGYRNIKIDAIKNARKTATATVAQMISEELSKNLKIMMEGEGFSNLLEKAVEKAAYRGIDLEEQLFDQEGKS